MTSEDLTNDSQSEEKSEQLTSKEFLKKVRTFAALTNNHLMNRKTIGDQILESAEIMKMAKEIYNKIGEDE